MFGTKKKLFKTFERPRLYKGPSKIKNWNKKFVCVYCGKGWFCHREEFGKMNCNYHTGKIINGKYECCGKNELDKGCHARCHTDKGRKWYIITKKENEYLRSMEKITLNLDNRCSSIMKTIGNEYVDLSKKFDCYCILLDTNADTFWIQSDYKTYLNQSKKYMLEKKSQNL